MPKSPTFLGNFCKGVKKNHFSSEINFVQLLWTFGNLFWSHCLGVKERERKEGRKEKGNVEYNFTSKRERERERERERKSRRGETEC